MIRGLVAFLLVLGATGWVAPAAHAAVTIDLRASRTSLDVGGRVTFSGTAAGARPGSTVRLQRRTSGSWRTLISTTLPADRSFTFRVTPPRGRPVYRVLKSRFFGQPAAVSRTVRLTVYWRPSLAVTSTTYLDVRQRSVTRLRIQSTGLAGVTLTERRLATEPVSGVPEWTATGRTVTLPASGVLTFDRPREARGTLLVLDAPAAAARRAVSSNPVEVAVAPVSYELSSGALELHDLRLGVTAVVTFQGAAGQVVGMAYDDVTPAAAESDLFFALVDPDGLRVDNGWFGTQRWQQRYGTQTVTLAKTGIYRLDVSRYNDNAPDVESLSVWLSTPVVVTTDDPQARESRLSATYPGQGVLLRYPVQADELVMQTDSYGYGESADEVRKRACPGHRSFSVDGTSFEPWRFTYSGYEEELWGLLSPAAGTMSALWTPCVTEPLTEGRVMDTFRVDTADITIGGEAGQLDAFLGPHDRNRFRFVGEAGQHVEFFDGDDPDSRACCPWLFTAAGALLEREPDGTYVLPVSGAYHAVFSDFSIHPMSVGVREVAEARGH